MSSPPSVSTSRIFAVPQLDEDSLKTAPGAAGRSVAGSSNTTHQTTFLNGVEKLNGSPLSRSANNTHSGFTLVADSSFGVTAGGSNPPSPHHSSAEANAAAFLQQQQAAAVAAAAAQLERDYYYTQLLLQQSPRPILLAVLTSLMDDFPTTLISPIKVRLEHFINANSALKGNLMAMGGLAATGGHAPSPASLSGTPSPAASMSHGPRRMSAASFVPNTNAAPWTPSSQQSQGQAMSVATTPYSHAHTPSHSRGNAASSSGKGKGKGGKEEQEMCSIHHSKRAMKHLQLNAETGLYECIHGFHCLVDESVPAKKEGDSADRHANTNSANHISPDNTLGSGAASTGTGFTVVGTDKADDASAALRRGSTDRFVDPIKASGYPSAVHPDAAAAAAVATQLRFGSGAAAGRGAGSSPADEELLAYTMQLLQSVRDIDEEE